MQGIQDTSSMTYRQIMGNGLRYETPKFQRDYTWEEEQWDDLWHDIKQILSNEEQDHYLGYLVLQTSNNNKNFSVIDGQQRLTTMSLIILSALKSLQDLSEKNIDADKNKQRQDELYRRYIGTKDPVTLIPDNKLLLNKNSNDYYKNYIVTLVKELPIRNINASEKRLRSAFQWFYLKISNTYKTGEQLANFIENIVDKLFFTVIRVSDQLNAFKVFETLNARGVQLSSADLLKNHLFSIVDVEDPHPNELNELEEMWSKMVDKLGKQKLEEYLRYYWNSLYKTVRKNQLFKEIRNKIKTKAETFSLVRQLKDSVDLYIALQDENSEFWQDNESAKKIFTN